MTREEAGTVLELMLATDHTLFSETEKDAIKTAVELLKEQEAKQVTIAQAHFGMKYGLCPRCEKQIDTLVNPSFCGNCGQAVKWE